MTIVGPSRLVLLRSGKYDYGEIELINPLHLVGPNNVGKTSLISVLQFLYIDDQRNMHFSREMSETRKYYFPDQNSYLLFECLTPVGYQVIGVQGLGPVRSYEFQRFAYQGQFDVTDYLDEDRRIRVPEEIKGRLAAKDFRLLEPRHLRAALTGLGDNKGVNLGLVPIRQRDHYERFRAVFGNLLRLAHLRQAELKQFLLDIHQGDFQQRDIDLELGYSSQYRKVCREAEDLKELRTIVEDVRQLLEHSRERDGLRRQLPGLWQEIRNGYAHMEAETRRQKQKIGELITLLDEGQERLDKEEQANKKKRDDILTDLGEMRGKLRLHEENAMDFRGYLPEFEESRYHEIDTRVNLLGATLGQAEDVSLLQVRMRVKKMEAELKTMQRQLNQFSRNAAARLLPLLNDEEQEMVFRIINPEILGLLYGEEMEILDEKKLKAALSQFLERVGEGVYLDEKIKVALLAMNVPDLTSYRDARTLQARIEEQEGVLQRERQVLSAAENMQKIRSERDELRKEQRQIETRLQRFREYEKRVPEIRRINKEMDDLGKRQREIDDQLVKMNLCKGAMQEEKRKHLEQERDLESRQESVLQKIRKLRAPDSSWPADPFVADGRTLDDFLELYDQNMRQHTQVVERFDGLFRRIEQQTYGKYCGENEASTMDNLQGQVDALEEREKAAQELWKSLATGLQSAFKGLNRDLDTLKSRIDELNRRLGKISISNLARLRLILREHPEWTSRIKTLVEADAMPLFGDSGAVSEAHDQLGDLLSRHRRVELADLFDLHFEVTSINGDTRRYPHLDSIESNGTTITIKVLINLLLLKGLLGDKEVSIPFYLDEASSLDRENLTAIVQEARKMGFVAVLASPEAMEAADSLYFLREVNGRVLLDPNTSLIRIERGATHGG